MTTKPTRITDISVLDAYTIKPQYYGPLNEDGQRPVLSPPHAWFIMITLSDGHKFYLDEDAPFTAYKTDDWYRDTQITTLDGQPLFRVDDNHVMTLEGLIARTRMEEKAKWLHEKMKRLKGDKLWEALGSTDWVTWPYPAYGSEAWEAEQEAMYL